MNKLDPVERQAMLFELENVTKYSPEYLDSLSAKELVKLFKDRCQR
ncbi:MAG: hypothetical protein Q8935_25505 [Bacillota bacterium]|nr:hypothetical protein [Bacillota bacterium]